MISSFHRNIKPVIQCTNCGENGHHFRICSKPIYSYGIMAFRNKNNKWNQTEEILEGKNVISIDDIEILMIQRKDSIGFIELIRAKYKTTDIEYIKEQVSGTTREERIKLLTKSFQDLWIELWGKTTFETKQYKQEYDQAKYKFEQLKEGTEIEGEFIKLETLIENIPVKWETPEWGFPKGRRNPQEKDIDCAVREFCEETGLDERDFSIFKNLEPIQEIFYGNNNIHYCHTYFFAWINSSVQVKFNKENELMAKEIGDIQWFPINSAIEHIRTTNINKREILLKSISIIQNLTTLIYDGLAEIEQNEGEHQNRREYEQFRNRGFKCFRESRSNRKPRSNSESTSKSAKSAT
jgi:8-oxo-dGTP pyrophosphatase MutT (NUDIX family)